LITIDAYAAITPPFFIYAITLIFYAAMTPRGAIADCR